MNSNLYRLIFDKRKGKLVPVAEHVTVCGKSGGEGLSSSGLGGVLSRRLCSLASFLELISMLLLFGVRNSGFVIVISFDEVGF